MEGRGEDVVTVATALTWASSQASVGQTAQRLLMVRRFAAYLVAFENRTEVPPRRSAAGIGCLRELAGLPIRTAIHAYNLVDSYIYGFALQEKTLPSDIAAAAETRRQDLTAAAPSLASQFPYLIEVVNELGTSVYHYTGQFERGLELILDGIEQIRHQGQGG